MGLVRSGGLTLVAILVFIMLLVLNSLLSITMSLKYQTLEPELSSVIKEVAVEQGVDSDISRDYPNMQEHCLNNTSYITPQEEWTVEIPCSVVAEGEGAVLDFSISSKVKEAYYTEYECESFWSCNEDISQIHLFSEMAHSYWKSKFMLALGVVLVLSIMGFIIAENRKNFMFLWGGLIILASLPFIKVSWFFSLFGDFETARILGIFFTQSFTVFLIMACIGVVFILLGVAWKFIGLGNWIYKITGGEKKAMKEEVKKELKSEMKSEAVKKK